MILCARCICVHFVMRQKENSFGNVSEGEALGGRASTQLAEQISS